MEKKWLFLVYAMYLALVCLISGIASVVSVFSCLDTVLDIFWPKNINAEYYTPSTIRDLIEDVMYMVLILPIFLWHMRLFRKEVKQ